MCFRGDGLHAGVSMVFPGFGLQSVRIIVDGISHLYGVAESLAGSGRGLGVETYMIRYIDVRWLYRCCIFSRIMLLDMFCLL